MNAAPVVSRAAARRAVARWRRSGKTIVFTNGCFDILHAGHAALFERARRAGDRLVVGLNTDASVRCLKGPGRPRTPLADRARLLGAIRWVDLVVPFSEATPLELIRTLSPDVLVKGSDYRACEIVGEREVRARGGKVLRVKLLPGRSTTRLLRAASA